MAINGNFIGLEYDSAEIRAAELKNENGKITVEACGRIPLEAGVIEDGFIRNPEAFKLSMNELLKNGSFTTNKVIFGVNNENVVMRYASFPKTDSERLRSIVLLQAQEYIPIPINEMEIDFVPAGDEKTEDGRDVSNVLIIAARTTMLTQSIDILSDSGLEVNDIDSSLLALSRGILGSGETEKFAILNLTDDMIKKMANKGCISGLNFYPEFLSKDFSNRERKAYIDDTIDMLKYMVNVGGSEFVALGSDYDGFSDILEWKDAGGMGLLTDAMEREGFSASLIENITYKNALRIIKEVVK